MQQSRVWSCGGTISKATQQINLGQTWRIVLQMLLKSSAMSWYSMWLASSVSLVVWWHWTADHWSLSHTPLRQKATLKNSFLPPIDRKILRPHGHACRRLSWGRLHRLLSAHFHMVLGPKLGSVSTPTELKMKTNTFWFKINPLAQCNEKWNSQGNSLISYAWPKYFACC